MRTALLAIVLVACGRPERAPREPVVAAASPDAGVPPEVRARSIEPHDDATVQTGVITVAAEAADATSLSADAVAETIRATYLRPVQRCYQELLGKDPDVSGSMVVSFEVDETGRAADVSVIAQEPELGACVEGPVAGWTFAPPEDDRGEPTSAGFHVVFRIVPD